MSHPKDTEALSPDELVLVDLLYGELEGEAELSARAAIDSDPELTSELAALRGLRALMAELPDEEPAPALSAQLLHAAAKHAPASRAARVAPAAETAGFFGWLKRFFQPMAMHPAMAAAATFVLVAGVAGALYVSGRVDVSEPSAPTGTAEVAERASAEARPEPVTTADRDKLALPESRYDEDVVLDEEAAGDMPSTGSRGDEVRARATRKPDAKPDTAWRGGRDPFDATSLGKSAGARPPAAPPPDKTAKKRRAAEKAPAAEAPGPVLQGTVGDVLLGGGDDGAQGQSEPLDNKESREREERLAQARLWHKRALDAARDGECDAVIEIGNRIRKLDSRYYDTVYLRDKSLYECRRVNAPNAE